MNIVAVAVVAAALWAAEGSPFETETALLSASNGVLDDLFGIGVAVGDTVAIVGAQFQDDRGTNAGAAYVFTTTDGWATWTQEAQLTMSDGTGDDRLGIAVGVFQTGGGNDIIAIAGAEKDHIGGHPNAGSVYVYSSSDAGNTWTQVQRLTSTNKWAANHMGTSCAVSGTTALQFGVIGGEPYERNPTGSGMAQVSYTTNGGSGWTHASLQASDESSNANFGISSDIAHEGLVAIVGAYRADPGSVGNAGQAYVFVTTNGWSTFTETAILTASDKSSNDNLGRSVAITSSSTTVDQMYALAGAPERSSSAGGVYYYESDDGGVSWVQRQIIESSDMAASDLFGWSAALSDTLAVIGAPGRSSGAGASYLFALIRGNWVEQRCFEASNAASSDSLGISVSVNSDGLTALAGASVGDGLVTDSGTAYAYPFNPGTFGDPLFIDFHGHTFLGGNKPLSTFELLEYEGESVRFHTSKARGVEYGYFIDEVHINRPGCGLLKIKANPGSTQSEVTGSTCALQRVAQGDNGLALSALGDADAIFMIKPHPLKSFTFLNIRIMSASARLRDACTGMLCDEQHMDKILL